MIITIDGPAGSGKSTVAETLAGLLGFYHFNSGSLYRGLTAYFIEQNIFEINDEFTKKLKNLKIDVKFIDNVQHVYVNNIDFTEKLRNSLVGELSPKFSVNTKIRKLVDDCQKEFTLNNNVVIDGRDIGSFVLPNAEYKFYLDCDINERAKRRYDELIKRGEFVTLDDIKSKIKKRDEFDMNKEIAPLKIPKNAIIVDSTNKTVQQVVDEILKSIEIK